MAIKKFKPTSPGRRHMTASSYEEVTTATPEKSLLEPLKKVAGVTTMDESLSVIRAAVISVSTVL